MSIECRNIYKGNRHQQKLLKIAHELSILIDDVRKRDDIDKNTLNEIIKTSDTIAKAFAELYHLLGD